MLCHPGQEGPSVPVTRGEGDMNGHREIRGGGQGWWCGLKNDMP